LHSEQRALNPAPYNLAEANAITGFRNVCRWLPHQPGKAVGE